MASKVIDLTGASSDVEQAPPRKRKRTDDDKENALAGETYAKLRKENGVNPRTAYMTSHGTGSVPKGQKGAISGARELSYALQQAIDGMSVSELKHWVRQYALKNVEAAKTMEGQLLVPGREVVRYHADSDSEDRGESESEIESEEEDSDDDAYGDREAGKVKQLRPITAGDDEMVPRKAVCVNCKEEFDVTLNYRGDCDWHPGEKDLDYDSYFWADHDEDCHGPMYSFIDDPSYADGFMWTCCEKEGSDTGCKSTRHKAAVNVLL